MPASKLACHINKALPTTPKIMAEDDMESFEVTDFDLDNEFVGARRSKKFTKEQQIYGVWADDSGGEEVREGRERWGM